MSKATPNRVKLALQTNALNLLQSLMLFSPEEIAPRVKKIPYMSNEGLTKLIAVLEEGHESQKKYLETFAEKDQTLIFRLNLLINKAKIRK